LRQYTVVQVSTSKKRSVNHGKTEVVDLYGHELFSLSAVQKWAKSFVDGRITIEDTLETPTVLCEENTIYYMQVHVSKTPYLEDDLSVHPP
jgi:hypothetical protein